MLAITNSDTVPLQHFSLLWRFTAPEFRQLSTTELAKIRPLSLSASKAVDDAVRSLFGGDQSRFPPQGFVNTARLDTSASANAGRSWLERILWDEKQEVVISWDADVAVVTMLPLFIKYWDDFCYPGSDDTTVVPLDLSWIVQYSHEEVLFFAERASTVAGS
jgi:hypothetical protein